MQSRAFCVVVSRYRAGIRSVVMTTVSDANIDEVPSTIDTVVAAGVNVFARYCPTSEEKDVGIAPVRYHMLYMLCAEKFSVCQGDALGIGSCYIGQGWTAFADPYGQEILQQWKIPADHYAVMQVLLGYPIAGDRHPASKPRTEGRIIRIGAEKE